MEAGLNTTIAYKDVPITKYLHENLHKVIGDKAKNLNCLANYYYDVKKCGVGWHGDERQ